jgi:mannose-6-phosphate isomerase-like protein (cupin superfamily)
MTLAPSATHAAAAPTGAGPVDASPLPHLSRSGDGESVTIAGSTATFRVESAQAGGAWSLMEYDGAPGFMAGPAHLHHRTTEMFYVLEGTLAVRLNEEEVHAAAGTCVVVPPGVVHTFWNPRAERVRLLAFASPGGHDTFLRELLALIAAAPQWPLDDPAPLAALAGRYDTVYVGG